MASSSSSSPSTSISPSPRDDLSCASSPAHSLPLQLGSLLPYFVSGFFNALSLSAQSAVNHLWSRDGERSGPRPQFCHRGQLVVTYLPLHSQWSFASRGRRPLALPTAHNSVASAAPVSSERDAPAKGEKEGEAAGASSAATAADAGPAFIGQVFTMCDAARRGLIAVRPVESERTRKLPYLPAFITSKLAGWVDRGLRNKKDDAKGPVFRFYFDKSDAAAYVKHIGLRGSSVGSCPLDAAYKYYKGKPQMFRFIADGEQVKVAKKLLQREQGRTAAQTFRGVPVFTAQNLTIAMSTARGVRWFTPYFFDKHHLDKLIGHSVDHYYHMLINARRFQRHSQVVDEFPEELQDDDAEGLMEPPEVQEFLEDMGQGGNAFFESALLKSAEIQFQDMVDVVMLGNKLSRQIAGLQPSFPVLVDSFERRAAAAETGTRERPEGRLGTPSQVQSHDNDVPSGTTSGRTGEGGGASLRNSSETQLGKRRRDVRAPFNLFGRNWGFQLHGGWKRGASSVESSSERQDEEARSDSGPRSMEDRARPKLTMVGIAMTEPDTNTSEDAQQRAMAAAAKDIEDRVRKGEGSGANLDCSPLFIADLGGPAEIWGRDSSTFPSWENKN